MAKATKSQSTSTEVATVPVTPPSTSVAVITEKPLNAGQLKVLKQIIDSDFTDLRSQLFGEIDRLARTRKQEIEDKFPANVENVAGRITDFANQLRIQANDFMNEVRGEGISTGGYDVLTIGTNLRGLANERAEREKNRLNESVTAMRNRVIAMLDSEQRRIDRQVLLQGVAPSASGDLIASIPNMEAILQKLKDDEVTAEEIGKLTTPL